MTIGQKTFWYVLLCFAVAAAAVLLAGCAGSNSKLQGRTPASHQKSKEAPTFNPQPFKVQPAVLKPSEATLESFGQGRGSASLAGSSQAPAPVKVVSLVWDYPSTLPQSNLTFQVYHATTLPRTGTEFAFYTNVPAPPVPIAARQSTEFFMVRASNTTTHLVSDWNH